MKPKSIPKQAWKWIEQLFCWFQVLWQHFMFLSCCIYLDAFSFIFLSLTCIFLALCIHFLSLSFPVFSLVFISIHVPFIFLSFSFQCAFMSSQLPFIWTHVPFIFSFHFVFMSFNSLSKGMEIAPWLGQGTECNTWLSAKIRLSLNNPSNI